MISSIQSGIGLIAYFLVFAAPCHAQKEASAAIQQIYNAYNNIHAIRFSGSLKMYAKNNPAKIIESMNSSYIIKDKNFSCRLGPVEMLLNDDYYVSVDKSVKIIMIGHKKDLSSTAGVPVLNLDQIKARIADKKIEAVNVNKGAVSVLQLTDTEGGNGFNTYTIEYYTVTGYMKKVLYEIRASTTDTKTMMLEINYTLPVITTGSNLFSEKTFFSVVNNKIQVAPGYKGFELVNQL